jgi:RNA polymerase sigma-70 factor (ECF subfamily)
MSGAGGEEDDAALIRACVAGAAGAFERLVERHARIVHHAIGVVLERAGARDDADLRDEAFVRTFSTLAADRMKALRSFEGRARLSTFLVVVARRVALRTLSEMRPRRADGTTTQPTTAATDPVDPGPGPGRRAEVEEERALVREHLATLPARDALALRMFYEDDRSHREIGAVLGVPVTHVGQILARAREKLKTRLGKSGLS